MNIYKSLNIDIDERVVFKKTAHDVYDMSMYEFSRWLCLVKGIEIIDDKASQLSIDLNTSKDWLKPLALQKFVDEETPGMVLQIKRIRESKSLCTT